MKFTVLVLIFSLVFCFSGFTFMAREDVVQRLSIEYPRDIENYAIRHNTAQPMQVRDSSDASYVDCARSYLKDNAENFLLQENLEDMKVSEVLRTKNSVHVVFEQTFNGLPVFESTMHVHFDSSSTVRLVNGCYKHDIIVKKNQGLIVPRADALQKVISHLNPSNYSVVDTDMVYIRNPQEDYYAAAYRFKIITDAPLGNWLACVDRDSGEIISLEDHIMSLATGKGYVFKDHPGLGDEEIEALLHLNGNGTLEGTWCKAVNEDFPGAQNSKHEFLYDRKDTHFDEVLVYYNTNLVHDYTKNVLGFDKMDFPMVATVHVRDNYDNAYFMPWTGGIYFGDGTKFNDLSHEGSVLFHEYGHATLNKIVSYSGGEAGAINEAQADYIACTMTNDPELGEYVCAKIDRPNIRNMENNTHYPEDIHNEVHADGKIWGAVCWDVRKALGATKTDQLMHQYKFFLPKYNGKFTDALTALIKADQTLYQGTSIEVIRKISADRGIYEGKDPSVERALYFKINNK